jgi:segregation and condensation protein A
MERFDTQNPQRVHEIVQFSYTIGEEQATIISLVTNGRQASFPEIFGHCKNRIHAITTFLALLELVNMQRLLVRGGESLNTFWLEEGPGPGSTDEEE